jgi:hypothetical protein
MEYVAGIPNLKRPQPSSGIPARQPNYSSVSDWISDKDPAWSWAESGRSGGVYELSSNANDLTLTGDSFRGNRRSEASALAHTSPERRSETPPFIANSSIPGATYPRLSPKSCDKYDYSYGNALVNWSREVLGIELMPWQQFLLREGCCRHKGRFRYRTVLAVVGRQNGKTLLASIRILGGICLFGEKFALGTAQNRAVSLESWNLTYEMAEEAGLPVGTRRLAQGTETFQLAGGRYRIVAATMGGSRGFSGVDVVLMDEIRQLKSWDAYGAIDKTRRARPDSQLWAITTEGDLESVVLNRLQTQARESIQTNKTIPLGYFEWSAPPQAHPGKTETWAQANPALGYTLDESVVQAEYETDPPNIFEVEVLCRKVAAIQGWVDTDTWDECASDIPFPTDQPFSLALDAGPELRHVSIVAGTEYQGFHHLELIASYAGPRALTSAENRLEALLSRWKPAEVVTLHRSPVEASVARIAEAADVPHLTVRPADWARACRAFYAAANQRTLRHPGGIGISQALAATKRGPDGLVSSVHRVNPESDIDAAIAAVLAMWTPTQHAPPAPLPNWTVF